MLNAITRLFRRRTRQPITLPTSDPTYVTTTSGFRYRLLNASVTDGYAALVAQLLPGELLYRMMDGSNRVMGNLFPVLMKDEVNFTQSVEAMTTRGWVFQLAAGIPVVHNTKEPANALQS